MSRSYSRGKHGIGAIIKVQIPKFNFAQVQKEALFVEEALQTQQFSQEVDARELTASIINQKRKEEVEQIQNEKLQNFNLLREKLNTSQGMFNKLVVMKTQSSKRNQLKSNNRSRQGNSSAYTMEVNKSIAQNSQPDITEDASINQWIDAYQKKGQKVPVAMPARNPVKIEAFLQKHQQLIGNNQKTLSLNTTTIRELQTAQSQMRNRQALSAINRPVRNQSVSFYESAYSKEEPLEETEREKEEENNFELLGLNTNKTLKNYDCWEEAQTPIDLVEQFMNDTEYHAKCPIYTKKKTYEWTPVQIIGYEAENDKFIVRIMENNTIKYVGRLSLMLKTENEKDFKKRLFNCKLLQRQADDELRFQRYVESLDDNLVSSLTEQQQTRIEDFFRSKQQNRKRRQSIWQIQQKDVNNPEKLIKNEYLKRITDDLFRQIHFEYKLYMKKFLTLIQMSDSSNYQKFIELRIKKRYLSQLLMKPMQKRKLVKENFQEVKEIIEQLPYFAKSAVTSALFNLTEKANKTEIFAIFNTDFHEGLIIIYDILSGKLPMNLFSTENRDISFELELNRGHAQMSANMISQWRQFLIQEIQDILRMVYSFYQTEHKKYNSSELARLLKKLDCIYMTYTKTNIVDYNIKLWVEFIQRFNPPDTGLINPWQISSSPLIILNLCVNANVRKKKKKGTEEETPVETIYFDPSKQQVLEVLQKPFSLLIQTVSNIKCLEKDLVPLVDINDRRVLDLEENDEIVLEAKNQIAKFVDEGYKGPSSILDEFKRYSYLYEKSQSQLLKSLFGDTKEKPNIINLELDDIKGRINDFQRARQEIQKLCTDEVSFSFFQVKTKSAKDILTQKANEILQAILQRLSEIVSDNIQSVQKNYDRMYHKMLSTPNDEFQLVELKNFIAETEVNLAKIRKEVDCINEYLELFEHVCFAFNFSQVENFFMLMVWPYEIRVALVEGSRNVQFQEQKFTEKLEAEKEAFARDLIDLQESLDDVKKYDSYKSVKDNASDVMGLRDRLDKAQEKVKSFNDRENLFKQPLSDYEDLTKILQTFEPYHKLWDIAMEFDLDKQDWYNGPFLRLQFPPIEKKVGQHYIKEIYRLTKYFQDLDDERPLTVVKELKQDVERFREKMWLVELLTTEAITKKPQVWREIFKECEVLDLEVNEELTLQSLLDNGMANFQEKIEEISKRAEKQWNIEKKLNELVEKIKEVRAEFIPYSTTYVLKSIDELQQLLDDQLNALLIMKASPYIKGVINKANAIEQKIILIQDTLEQWIKTQRGWMYLEPIFSSDDIKKKLPQEKQKFDIVDKNWRQTIEVFFKDPLIWEGIDSDKYKVEFEGNNKLLDEIQKSLSEYLETKRKYFPRFFFLSDEELLEILAQTKDPLTVQKHINKCFEAINQLYFDFLRDDPNQQLQLVTSMISPEKETVQMYRPVNVNEGEKKGNVERWLLEIEQVMMETMRKITFECLCDNDTKRGEWVLKWPGQSILCVNMIWWTQQSEQTIMTQNNQGAVQSEEAIAVFPSLSYYEEFLQKQLSQIVKLLYQSDLENLARIKLSSLIVLDVHNRDVIQELSHIQQLQVTSFEWMSNMRYYWNAQKGGGSVRVKMVNTDVAYGFEYLGNSGRLVITPLTDRCYRTLLGAFLMNYGGAPEGPAGTGKTETVKDLAKAIAIQCIVFNCSDGLNYLAMSKFFKGLASSGAWCCFDEFNRIDLEVLSVIASQVLTIQQAIKDKKRIFFFDNAEYTLITSCSINITMNPGYAGRSELPDNLKVLFRPCAMMVPDYKMISAIFLYSVGFQEARHLSTKVVASLKLSSEQLSSQDHYDFGMRALKAILTAAGNLKKQMPDESEEILCLRALMDVNLPKFTHNDIPLFLSITSDLFPMVKLPPIDTQALQNALTNQCTLLKLQPQQSFLDKCIQLFDTINVRHGLMLVGQAFSGKSKVLECLQNRSITQLTGTNGMVPVQTYKLNPKAITSDQLYGRLDQDTKAWSDGVVAIIMRDCSKFADLQERRWVVFDGPVDAIWIENMNTVLDDNKKLCLTSGEIIKMTPLMTMMFEVEDLASASPATVSRCGMVYMEPNNLGWNLLLESFILSLEGSLLEKYIPLYKNKIKWLFDCALSWIRKNGGAKCFPIYYSEMTIAKNVLLLLKAFQDELLQDQTKVTKDLEDTLSNLFIFSVYWGIGGALDEQSRKGFNELILRMITASPDIPEQFGLTLIYPFEPQSVYMKFQDQSQKEKANIFEFFYDKTKNLWLTWVATQPQYLIQKERLFHELIIPTSDLIRNTYFLHLCVRSRMHLLLAGPTGTGKTVNLINEINTCYFTKDFTNLQTTFSGQTTANALQRVIESKINSRRRKGYFGPEEGKKLCVIFIDDLNMPQKERYGAQPPIELLRQWMDVQGWYDLDSKEFKFLQDIVFTAAMLPPTAGRNSVTLRYLRHYYLLYAQPFENDSLNRIFGLTVEWILVNLSAQVPKQIQTTANQLVPATIDLYNNITRDLLPTPAKSHYTYNLRDIRKVFQGISQGDLRGLRNEEDLIKLWAHECSRVFQDRLLQEDEKIFENLLKETIQAYFRRDWEETVKIKPLLFSSFVPTIYPDNDTTKRPFSNVYCELTDREALKRCCQEQLDDYNNCFPHNRLHLVLFMQAIENIIKIVRVLSVQFGHLLLVGVGGSGRKSLTQIASFIALQNETYLLDQRQYQEELQKLMRVVGLDLKATAFVFSDTQVEKESMLEDICNLLNNGEIPNLFGMEEKAKLLEDLSSLISAGTPQEKFQKFIVNCKKNLHVVMLMSPVGESFRKRLRTFPGLVNCTTINWYQAWPQDALNSTAKQFISNEMNLPNDEELKGKLVAICVDMQERVKSLAEKFEKELRWYFYVTPTSYLELLKTFKQILQKKQDEINSNIHRYSSGVQKILSTEKEVSNMKAVLEDLQPKLERATIENSHMLINLQKKQKEADAKKQVCQQEEQECNQKREEANLLRDDCQQELDKVLPLLAAAADALEKITRDDINLLKSFQNPPPAASIVMEGVCYTFNEDQNVRWKPKEAGSIEKIQDFWEYAKKSLLNDKLIKRVKDFKEEQIRGIPPLKIQKLKNFVHNPMFEREKVFNASKAAGNLSLWIRAVIDTYDALLVVDPKREQLKVAERNLSSAEAVLAEKKAALAEVLEFLFNLEKEYMIAKTEKEKLEAEVNRCRIQLERAERLIQGLGGEKEAWKRRALDFQDESLNVIGDAVLASGIISYLGIFPVLYRSQASTAWKDLLNLLQLQYSRDFSLQKLLSDPITVGQWTNQQKLPNDSFSIENAIILKNSDRFPLLIDPQTQANQWIKLMEPQLTILKHGDVQSILENAIAFGTALLLENVGETIPSIYESILAKQLIKQGGQLKFKFGEQLLDYSPLFRFYMTTKLNRPHYRPEICVRVTMLNFQVTQEGLEDQMLNIVVKQEEPVKEEQRLKNVRDFYENKTKQKATEDLILKLLNDATGNLLEDELLIETLQKSKIESMEIEEKLKKQEHDREVLNAIRNSYREVAKRVSQLYFVLLELGMIEASYQWSLEYYINHMERSIKEAHPGKENRCLNIIDKFQMQLYESVCQSLLEKDKLIFSFLLQIRILIVEGSISQSEVRLMMMGGTYTEPKKDKPPGDVDLKRWLIACELSDREKAFTNLDADFVNNQLMWKMYLESEEPQTAILPGEWEQQLNSFQKLLLVLRLFRPDKFTQGIQRLIQSNMGGQFIDPPPFSLEKQYDQSDPHTPIIFILSSGADPRMEIQSLADKLGLKNNLVQLSLGQGQGQAAEKAILQAALEGKWVLLQNCHLAKSFMPELERIHEQLSNTHDAFRLWLTTAPSNVFPVSLLQKGIKLTYEPPRGIRNNLLRVYLAQDAKKFEESNKPYEYKKLLFGLAFFHALILERRKYGPLGWNIPYEFTQADFTISSSQLRMFLDEYEEIPWQALNYLAAETNYGGRVTDPKDRRLLCTLLSDYYDQNILLESYRFSQSGLYYAPNDGPLQNYIDFIKDLPINDQTEIFGLHSNAEITSAILETNFICSTILSLLPRTSGSQGQTTEQTIKQAATEILQKLPSQFNLEEVSRKHPVNLSFFQKFLKKINYDNSMNTVLQQELIRFNKLNKVIFQSLANLVKAIEGLVVMSSDLEDVANGVFDNKIPELWNKVSYPSLKPMSSYINDFIARLKFMKNWVDYGTPATFWISGFYFTQSFLTGVSQNYARKHHIPIDTLSFKFDFMDQSDFHQPPEDGCYVNGLFLDGARWDKKAKILAEAEPQVLYYTMPFIWIQPFQEKKREENEEEYNYECPVYKTSKRAGTLSTTGHSTNFVLSIDVPIKNSPKHWIKRGVAMLTQLDD